MAEVKRNVVNGVNTILMHGKNYVEVAERVRLVHDQKREFEVLESTPFQVGERCLWRVVVKVDGRLYTGNAEVKLNARAGSPDATNPFECGETSALGRALAFAGFGSVESIASFDEVYRAEQSNGNGHKPDDMTGGPAPEKKPDALAQAIEAVKRQFAEIYPSFIEGHPDDWFRMFQMTALGEVPDELGSTHVAKLRDYLNKKKNGAKAAATSGK